VTPRIAAIVPGLRSPALARIGTHNAVVLAGAMAAWASVAAVAQVAPAPPGQPLDPRGGQDEGARPAQAVIAPGTKVDADWIAQRVRRFDDPALEVREGAMFELIAGGATPEQLVEHARAPGLSSEAGERLAYAARQWFSGTERAAMGVSFGFVRDDARTAGITDTIRGFDAARVLQPGDVISAVNGEPVTYQQLRAQIVSHDPGQQCTLGVVRSGRPLTVTVTFGRWSDLNSGRGGFVDESVFIRALAIRLQRAGWPVPEPVLPTLDAAAWAQVIRAAGRAHADAERDNAPSDDGGEIARPAAATRVGGQGRVQSGELEREADEGSRRIWRRLSDEALSRERDLMKMQLEQLRNEAARMGLEGPARQRILDALQDRVRQIDQELLRRRP